MCITHFARCTCDCPPFPIAPFYTFCNRSHRDFEVATIHSRSSGPKTSDFPKGMLYHKSVTSFPRYTKSKKEVERRSLCEFPQNIVTDFDRECDACRMMKRESESRLAKLDKSRVLMARFDAQRFTPATGQPLVWDRDQKLISYMWENVWRETKKRKVEEVTEGVKRLKVDGAKKEKEKRDDTKSRRRSCVVM